MNTETTLQRLERELRDIQADVDELIRQAPVKWFNRHGGGLVILGGADYYFEDPDAPQSRRQTAIKRTYSDWFERTALLFRSPPADLAKRLAEADKRVRNWIELGTNYVIGRSLAENASKVGDDFRLFYELLALHERQGRTVLVPDTNAMLSVADIRRFQPLANGAVFDLVLLPTVLSELDNLKIYAREPQFREKVSKTVRRIKGWRKQGSLHAGLTVHRNITIRAVAREPRMTESLSWLDPTNRDDRILASALELQAAEPSSHVVLVTADLNLQNKADAAHLPYEETP